MILDIWNSYICTAVKKRILRDPRRQEHNWSSSWQQDLKKKIQARTGFEPLTFAIPVQRSTNWA